MNAAGQRRFRNILMAGLPGAGKSTFAKVYAQMSRTEFVELDKYVERLAGKSIAEIFANDGEAAFRELEAQCLERLLRRQRCTIALGGGTLTHPQSLALARELGCIVWLTAPVDVLAARLWPVSPSRPLLADCQSQEHLKERLEALLSERRASYESAADIILDTTYSSVDTLKIELSWLERSLLNRPVSSDSNDLVETAQDGMPARRIPLADPSFRSPREQRSGKEMVEKMERMLKSQRHKDRGGQRNKGDKKEKRPTQGAQERAPRAEAQGQNAPRPRPRQDGQNATAPQRPRPKNPDAPSAQGPVPRPRQESAPMPKRDLPKPVPAEQPKATDDVKSGPVPRS